MIGGTPVKHGDLIDSSAGLYPHPLIKQEPYKYYPAHMLTGLEVMQHPVVSAQPPIPTLSSSLSSPDNNKDNEIGRCTL